MGQDNTQLPNSKVVYVVSNPTTECLDSIKSQTYEDVGIVYKNDIPAPVLFNKAITDVRNPLLFGFMSGDTILDKYATQKVVDKITLFKNQDIGAIYGDSLVGSLPSYHHSFSKDFVKKKVLNPNIYINGKIRTPLFNIALDHLYFYDALIKISANAVIYHIPEILYKSTLTHNNISDDLKKLGINVHS